MRSAPFARLVGLVCATIGALMLGAPGQFGAAQYVVLRPYLGVWGIVLLSTGTALLATTALDVRAWLRAGLLVCGGAALIALAGVFGLAGAWTELAVYTTLGLAALIVAATPRRRAGIAGRHELLGSVIGLSSVILGITVLLTDPAGGQSAGLLGPNERWYGIVLALTGGLLFVNRVGGASPTAFTQAGRLGTATALIVYVGISSFPQRTWTDALLYASFALALALEPRLEPRFQHIDAASLRIRLVLVLCAAATLPLVALFIVDAKREELAVARLNLTMDQSLAEGLAREMQRDVNAYEAEARALAALADLANMPPDQQTALLHTFTSTPHGQVFATFDAAGTALARSDDKPLVDLQQTSLYADVRGAVAQTVDRTTYGRDGTVSLQIAAPIRAVDGQLSGIVLTETDHLTNSLTSVDAGPGGRIYFADSNAATPDAAIISPNPLATSALVPLAQLQEVLDGPTGSGSVTYSNGGEDWLAGFARVPNIHQVIVVDRPAALALAEVRNGREAMFGLLLACAALAGAAGILIAGQLDEPLRILAAAAARFSDGDTTVRLPRSKITEVALLANNFATMRDALAARTDELKRAEGDARRAEAGLRELNQVLEQRVVERTTDLEQVSKQKSEFLTSMSHELRTPLNAIIGFSEIMLDHDVIEIPEEQRNTYLDHIQRSGQHLLGLVNDILDLAKVEAGHMELSVQRVPLQAALVGCVDVIRGLSDPKLLTIATQCEPADALVTADPARLKQILYNLLANAVKFTPMGGQISVSAQVDATEALIAVRDSGIGIRSEDQDLIFKPFRQVKSGAQPGQEGTGLGLPLVRELVELHGGRVWLGSTPGAGSCFTFTLPHGLDRLPQAVDTRGPATLAAVG